MDRKLVLQNGMELQAKGFGSQKEVIAELVFNTSMVGYQGDSQRSLLYRTDRRYDLSADRQLRHHRRRL